MTAIDYTLMALVGLSAVFGLMRGFLREVLSLVGLVLALWFAWHYSDIVAPYLGGALADEPFHTWAARVVVFVAVLLITTLISAIVNYFVRMSIFSGLDRFLGFLFGLLRGAVIAGVAVMLGQMLRLDGEPWWKSSRLLPYAEMSGSVVRGIVGERLREPG